MLDYLKVIENISAPLQIFCKSLLSNELHHVSLYRAIACGAHPDPQTYASLKTISLWHLLIVSGGHFTALVITLNFIKPLSKLPVLKSGILLFFCFWTGFQEPAFFSFVQIQFEALQKKKRLKLQNTQAILYSGVICLLLFPKWSNSYSFLLSWLCRISILAVKRIKSLWHQALIFYIILLPICASFSFISPQSILWNCLFGPLLSFLLFPLSLLIMLMPNTLGKYCDTLVDKFLMLVSLFQNTKTVPETYDRPAIFRFWIYLIMIHFIFFITAKIKEHFSHKDHNPNSMKYP
jgi:ComEC/Rec2-related protein